MNYTADELGASALIFVLRLFTAFILQPSLGEAVLAKGTYHYSCLKDYDAAVRYYEQARPLRFAQINARPLSEFVRKISKSKQGDGTDSTKP